MDLIKRKKLNHDIRALAHGVLGFDEDLYRQIVSSADPKSEGHITKCDDESANMIYLQLQKMKTNVVKREHSGQTMLMARLMDILDWKWSDTAAYCYRITGHRTTKLCNSAEMSKIIRGMIATIDHHLANGKIVLPEWKKIEYEKHTHSHRQTKETL